jgi:hypothetical protein
MGIEWYRDLSITLMGFAATAAFIFTVILVIFAAILCYLMYRKIAVMLLLGKTLLNSVNDTVNTVEESIKTASRNINDTISEVKDGIMNVSKSITDTVTGIQERMKPLLPVLAVIQGISEGIKSIREIFKKETYEGGKVNE